ncbi:MAG: response regulator [Candidatus Krumholzibacteriota bacterium]|nr:response regulator [Candidatus Krumholzibacteriota bacterium]
MPDKILIVDDEVHLAKILQFTLEHAGYEVVTAFDGQEALDLVEREGFDLIILDLMLPLVDGYKVCNILKKDKRFSAIPVIILSARDFEGMDIEEEIEAELLMSKPFNTGNLLVEISQLLESSCRE